MQLTKRCFFVIVVLQVILGMVLTDKVRIHVPTKVKTIYKTKFVKVPEHHHYFHEKVKQVPKFVTIHKDHDHDSSLLGDGF